VKGDRVYRSLAETRGTRTLETRRSRAPWQTGSERTLGGPCKPDNVDGCGEGGGRPVLADPDHPRRLSAGFSSPSAPDELVSLESAFCSDFALLIYVTAILTCPSESRTASPGSPPGRGGGSSRRAPTR